MDDVNVIFQAAMGMLGITFAWILKVLWTRDTRLEDELHALQQEINEMDKTLTVLQSNAITQKQLTQQIDRVNAQTKAEIKSLEDRLGKQHQDLKESVEKSFQSVDKNIEHLIVLMTSGD